MRRFLFVLRFGVVGGYQSLRKKREYEFPLQVVVNSL